MIHLQQAMSRTDWAELANQKQTLIELIDSLNKIIGDKADTEHDHLTGILNFLDAIQDAASADGYRVYGDDQPTV